jgi:hypothetical protein
MKLYLSNVPTSQSANLTDAIMKHLLLIFLPIAFLVPFRRNYYIGIGQQFDCQQILDSADVMIQTGDLTIHWNQHKLNEKRNLIVSKWFEQRTFSEFKCLLENDNKLYNVYGFIYAAFRYTDSLKGRYMALFDDTTALQFQAAEGIVDAKMTIGMFLKKMFAQIIEDNQNWSKEPLVKEKVSSFIKDYALYPDTYKPIGFPFFSTGKDSKGLLDYSIRHEYQIKNKKNKLVQITSQFVLAPNLSINIIAQDSTAYISSFPPMLSEWLESYGRKLNHKDSANLFLK